MAKTIKTSLLEELKGLLQKDKRFIADGQLLKNIIIEHALKLDKDLVKLLLSKKRIKEHFFADIDGTLIFDKDKFIAFVDNKQFLPDSYTAFKNKIGLTLDGKDDYLKERKDVVLVWPYKDCVLEGGQAKEEQKRDEIFWNETLAPDEIDRLFEPKVLADFKRFDKKGEHKVSEIKDTDSLIIKGNNLLALHSLKKRFAGKVKLIYIDPPYNTGGDANIFSYNNSFNHSTWLTFMKNRLETARDFLCIDGFIAIAIDHAELFYLGTLADEVLGRENRIAIITVQHNPKGRNQAKFFSANSEFMFIYAKNISNAEFQRVTIDDDIKSLFEEQDNIGKFRYEPFMRARTVWSRENRPRNWYPIYVSKDLTKIASDKTEGYNEVFPITNDGKEMAWKNIKESFDSLNKDDYFIAKEENGKIRIYHKYREQQVFKNVWVDKKYQSEFHGTKLLKEIVPENKFSYPKSIYLVLDTIKITTSQDDIILDFFGGSGTTAHAVLELNKKDGGHRKCILVEQLDEHIEICKKRMQKVIENNSQGDFVYCELMKWNEVYIGRIQKAKTKANLAEIWQVMREKGHLSYKLDFKEFDKSAGEFEQLSFEDQKRFLLEVLDKNQLYVNYCDIEDTDYNVSTEDKRLNKLFYGG